MNVLRWVLLGGVLSACLLGGCTCQETREAVDDTADYATGAAPVRQGEEMKKQLRGITDERNRQAEEAQQP